MVKLLSLQSKDPPPASEDSTHLQELLLERKQEAEGSGEHLKVQLVQVERFMPMASHHSKQTQDEGSKDIPAPSHIRHQGGGSCTLNQLRSKQ